MRFRLLYADPPWAYRNCNRAKKFSGTAGTVYQTWSINEMARWDVVRLAEPDSLLFLWATFPTLPQALQLMEAWGFSYVTAPFVWSKTYPSGKPFCGVGFWTRNGAEVVLLGRRGKGLPRVGRGVRQVVVAPNLRPHSTKPPEIRDRIVDLVGDVSPRIELFARSGTEGWYATGLEHDGRLITDAIEHFASL